MSVRPLTQLLRRVAGLAGSFAAWSVLSQAAGFAGGIMIVRSLDKHSYALYAIVIGTLGMATVLSSSGISSTLLSLCAGSKGNRRQIAGYLASAAKLRRRLAPAVLVPVCALLCWLLVRAGAALEQTALLALLFVLTAMSMLIAGFSRVGVQVFREYGSLRWVMVANAAVRLVLTATMFIVGVDLVGPFVAVSLVASLVDMLFLRRVVQKSIGDESPDAGPGYAELRSALWRTLPALLAVLAAEQFIRIALTFAGNVEAIAEIGALSRFAVAFAVVNGVAMNVFAPELAHVARVRKSLMRALWRVTAGYGLLALLFVAGSWASSDLLLWLLGTQYAGLNMELVVISAGAAIANFSGYGIGAFNHARGWNRLSWTLIPLVLVWGVVCLATLDLTRTFDAVVFAASLSLVRLANQILRTCWGFSRLRGENTGGPNALPRTRDLTR